jgi:hypothetical protein
MSKPLGNFQATTSSTTNVSGVYSRPFSAGGGIGRQHNIVEKDYFRMMKINKQVEEYE